jgi:hypothetical protein
MHCRADPRGPALSFMALKDNDFAAVGARSWQCRLCHAFVERWVCPRRGREEGESEQEGWQENRLLGGRRRVHLAVGGEVVLLVVAVCCCIRLLAVQRPQPPREESESDAFRAWQLLSRMRCSAAVVLECRG